MPNDIDVDPDVPTYLDETIAATPNGTQDDIDTHASLDDLCRMFPLATVSEIEKQSVMDARVSTWKKRIKNVLEEQDKNLPFDIGSYGEQILDTLSSRTDRELIVQELHLVVRLLVADQSMRLPQNFLRQLVNGISVDLDIGHATNEFVCYTAENTFHVRFIGPNRRAQMETRFARKRIKSPLQNVGKTKI